MTDDPKFTLTLPAPPTERQKASLRLAQAAMRHAVFVMKQQIDGLGMICDVNDLSFRRGGGDVSVMGGDMDAAAADLEQAAYSFVDVMRADDLGAPAFNPESVWNLLRLQRRQDPGHCWLTVKEIADALTATPEVVEETLKGLLAREWISCWLHDETGVVRYCEKPDFGTISCSSSGCRGVADDTDGLCGSCRLVKRL